jgi:dipeptidyl aminopeptidase/acylaminoacyl peptidase
MPRILLSLLLAAGLGLLVAPAAPEPAPAKLLIAFASVRGHHAPPYPRIYFYEHDGVGSGKIVGSITSIDKGINFTRSDMHPSLTADGRYCVFMAQFGIQDGGRIEVWDRKEQKVLPHAKINDFPNSHQMAPSVTADGKQVAFTAWNRPGSSPRWDLFLFDLVKNDFVDLPKLNSQAFDERMPALSADGRWLAYVSNARGGVGVTDVYLYDLREKKVVPVPEMNSPGTDIQPSLSGDGRLVAFISERPDGKGGRDIYLYDRSAKKFLPLPGLNSPSHEQSPALSPDGRYIAFVSERLDGAGERDVYLYDRETQKLLPTPGLNSKEDDFDPSVIVLSGSKPAP